ESPEGERIALPILLPGDAPVRRYAVDAVWGDAVERADVAGHGIGRAGLCRAVAVEFDIKVVEEPEISAEPGRSLRQRAVDLRFGVGGNAGDRRDERIAPSGRAVPYILRGRIVVERDAVDEIGRAHGWERAMIGKAQIGIVDADRIGRGTPGELEEGAQIVGDLAGVEETERLRELRRVLLRHVGRFRVGYRLGECR